MIYLSLLIAVLLIIIAVLSNKFIKYKNINEKKISFFESLKLAGLPVVTMTSNGVDINFLLDTGSNKSFIDNNLIENIDAQKIEGKKAFVTGINNKASETYSYNIKLNYKNNIFENEFQAFDFEQSVGHIKEKTGVKIDGIIGSDLLTKYKYIINYEDYTAYNQ